MASKANVISFQALPAGSAKHPNAQALLSSLRGLLVRTLVPALQEVFAGADDSLFRMAERAPNNVEQSYLFEAMRTLRLKRQDIERSFVQQAAHSLMQLHQPHSASGGQAPLLPQPLSLLDNDELEQAVAFDAMQGKVLSLHAPALNRLTLRLGTLSAQRLLDEQNPLGPHALCQGFAQAVESLGFSIELKLMVFKLFENHVLGASASLFEQANAVLIEAGILPDLTLQPAKAQAPSTPEPMHNAFAVFQDLLSQARPVPEPAAGVPIAEADLMRVLSHLQQRAPEAQGDLGQQVSQVLGRLNAKTGVQRVVEQNDADVINLVSMLFEFILDDRTLPDALNALIGRLQIPILKVALLDKSFFTHTNHPARRLLNEMASAALGISSGHALQRDTLYRAIEHVVQRVLNEFVDDVSLFDELLTYFMSVTQAERRRSALLEQRMRDAELGRAKAESARLAVTESIASLIKEHGSCAGKDAFIEQGLSRALTLSFLKEGPDSPEFVAHMALLDELLRVQVPDDALLQKLIEVLDQAGIAAFNRRELLQLIVAAPEASTAAICIDEFAEILAEPEPEPEPEPVAVREVIAQTIVEPERASLMPEESSLAVLDVQDVAEAISTEALHWAQNLRVGSWVELTAADQSKLRCKLAAVIKITGRYVFVNRSGIKVLEHTEDSLAQAYSQAQVRLLDDALLFDRALESVIDNLRQLKHS